MDNTIYNDMDETMGFTCRPYQSKRSKGERV